MMLVPSGHYSIPLPPPFLYLDESRPFSAGVMYPATVGASWVVITSDSCTLQVFVIQEGGTGSYTHLTNVILLALEIFASQLDSFFLQPVHALRVFPNQSVTLYHLIFTILVRLDLHQTGGCINMHLPQLFLWPVLSENLVVEHGIRGGVHIYGKGSILLHTAFALGAK